MGAISPASLSHDMKMNILSIKHQADALRSDLHSLRRLQQINKESILETVDDAWKKIKVTNFFGISSYAFPANKI